MRVAMSTIGVLVKGFITYWSRSVSYDVNELLFEYASIAIFPESTESSEKKSESSKSTFSALSRLIFVFAGVRAEKPMYLFW